MTVHLAHGTAPRRSLTSLLRTGGTTAGWPANGAFVLGGGLVVGSAALHLHLWLTGYRHIATIGPLFLLQFAVGVAIGLVVMVTRRTWAGLIGTLFALATIAGFLLSVNVGLFGFQDSWSAPLAGVAFALESAAAALLLAASALSARVHIHSPRP